ncbi:site-2 protease family protein [Pseudonocardia nigra]|uniref:site-2 protease family protein n=1 Tax=Pseudonocardia nigra TaxID=1921578 RepID=UPI001C60020E|nr:site-2 protease family protein [Pseudonocardia nigra]
MGATFHLGRIAGIRVGVHWSVLVIFMIIAVGLAGQRFPAAYPQHRAGAYVAAGVLTAVVFFASLLAHEISHAIVARRNGLRADDITLWLFGGVARLSGEARDPGAELRIAGVGPLVSLLLGGVFLLLAWLLGASGYEGLVLEGLAWLGGINIALAVFNVVPAAPLDGGRLLRSVIWWRTGDRLAATVWAGRAGQVFGWILVALGLFTFVTRAGFGGLWLALIGWFLVAAATAESRQATVREQLGGMAVRELMTPDPMTAPASMTVEELLGSDLIRHRHSTFPLTEDGQVPAGLVTFTQIRRVPPQERASTRLRDIACPMDQVAQARPEDRAAELLPRLSECAEGRALVISEGRLVGIVSPSDVSRVLRWMSVPGQHSQRASQ